MRRYYKVFFLSRHCILYSLLQCCFWFVYTFLHKQYKLITYWKEGHYFNGKDMHKLSTLLYFSVHYLFKTLNNLLLVYLFHRSVKQTTSRICQNRFLTSPDHRHNSLSVFQFSVRSATLSTNIIIMYICSD